MRNLGVRIDQSHDLVKAVGGNMHCTWTKGSAHGGGVEEGAETGDGADVAQVAESVDQVGPGQAWSLRGFGKGPRANRKALLPCVEVVPVDRVQGVIGQGGASPAGASGGDASARRSV